MAIDVPKQSPFVKQPLEDHAAEDVAAAAELEEIEAEEEILEPKDLPKTWIIGKPPERGGKPGEYHEFHQRSLGFMARNRFFALVGRTLSTAIRETGGSLGGLEDVIGERGDGQSGTLVERGRRLREHDFKDASGFVALAMELIGYNADFLSECYVLWLDVNRDDVRWFKNVIERPWNPEEDQWGLSQAAGIEMIEIFVDQNYEEIREYFLGDLVRVGKRVAQKERARKKKEEGSAP